MKKASENYKKHIELAPNGNFADVANERIRIIRETRFMIKN